MLTIYIVGQMNREGKLVDTLYVGTDKSTAEWVLSNKAPCGCPYCGCYKLIFEREVAI